MHIRAFLAATTVLLAAAPAAAQNLDANAATLRDKALADRMAWDVEDLIDAGAPFVEFEQDASRYFDLHHSADDTLDKVDPAELAQNVAVWTSFLYTVADSDIDFRKLATEAK